ncbi:MAG: hypothetical protein COT74_02020 [Bdellovibrionales bacterium CG10_big_fil_rev_8_21_14_0_10_45_34]|nr:MAG: hypothetical protein COT74_02020 [Bdellovibrionales bacterium CG10_big_fil_rev_8_21_14_0_10_45_34]
MCPVYTQNGGNHSRTAELIVPPLQLVVNTEFSYIPAYNDPLFLHQKYTLENLSIAQISRLIGSSKEAVRRGLERYQIPIREKSRHHGNPSQPRYGQKVVKGRSTEFKAEQRVITAIQEMKAQGLSLRQIAKVLDQMGISTKCRGKKWHPEMVKRVLASSKVAHAN